MVSYSISVLVIFVVNQLQCCCAVGYIKMLDTVMVNKLLITYLIVKHHHKPFTKWFFFVLFFFTHKGLSSSSSAPWTKDERYESFHGFDSLEVLVCVVEREFWFIWFTTFWFGNQRVDFFLFCFVLYVHCWDLQRKQNIFHIGYKNSRD